LTSYDLLVHDGPALARHSQAVLTAL